jgi:Na+/H+ antiporter NhaC
MTGPGKDSEDLKDYADGWITERKNTDVPGFLKLAIPVIALGCLAYLVLQRNGDVSHVSRGPLVSAFNRVSLPSPAVSFTVAGIAALYAVIVTIFAVRTHKED